MRIIFLFILISIEFSSLSQRAELTKNYRNFDRRLLHFGFMLGGNSADFSTQYKPNLLEEYNYSSITNQSQPGFQLGIISSMKLGTPMIRMRFIPTLSFQERILFYNGFDLEGLTKTIDERVGSTNLDFPLLFKFRTLRYNNFAAYIITGAQYTLDLQTKENSTQSFSDPFLKIRRHDYQGQIGAGVDFFLEYFKFGIELKFSHGLRNSLIQDNTRLSSPIDQLYNRIWWISLTFEG
mgnify:CR=1 FL=1|jgi:hypothetical protein